jgi:hypothetical protein
MSLLFLWFWEGTELLLEDEKVGDLLSHDSFMGDLTPTSK